MRAVTMMHPRLLLLSGLVLLSGCVQPTAAVFTPAQPLPGGTAFVGANQSGWFVYPEAADPSTSNYSMASVTSRQHVGIAISGGGMRAATTGLGWLRALHNMSAVDAARYMASNSGGSWLLTAFSFQQQVPLSDFLGEYVPPQELTLERLRQPAPPGSFEAAIANANLLAPGVLGAVQAAAASLRRAGPSTGPGAWSNDVGRAFLEPFGLNVDASTLSAEGTAGPVHQALASLDPSELTVYRYSPTGPVGGSNGGSSGGRRANASSTNSSTSSSGSCHRPFPIVMGSVMLVDQPLGFYPVEFTPLYVGVAPFFNTTPVPLGGGFVDPLALNSPAPEPPPQLPPQLLAVFAATNATGSDNNTLLTAPVPPGGSAAALPGSASNTSNTTTNQTSSAPPLPSAEFLPLPAVKPQFAVPLKLVMGISSSFITNGARPGGELARELTGTETLSYWSPLAFKSAELPFADGGSADNLAVTPLLRRRVTRMVVLVAALQNISSAANASDWGGYQWDVSALFGAAPATHPAYDKRGEGQDRITGIPSSLFNRKMQVFPTADYQALYDGLRATTAAGGPTHHAANYSVLTNPYQAIRGGWTVEVLWIVNQQQTAWEAALPAETQALLAAGRDLAGSGGGRLDRLASGVRGFLHDRTGVGGGDPAVLGLQGFPLISTGKASYSRELTRLLSQQAAWQAAALQPQITRLLAGGAQSQQQ